MFPNLLQTKFVEKYLTARKVEVGPWLAQFALEELILLDRELASSQQRTNPSNQSTLIVGNISYPLFQHLSPALAALKRGDEVSLLLPNQLPHTSTVLKELANEWSMSTIADVRDFNSSKEKSFLWWQSPIPVSDGVIHSFTTTSLCIPSSIPFFIDDSANLDQVKTLLKVLWEKKAPGFLPQQFWVHRVLLSDMVEYLQQLGEQPIQGEAGTLDPEDANALYVLSYRSVRQVTEAIERQGSPNLIYWFSRYKPTVKAAQQVASLCGIALNGILPSLQQRSMEIGPHRAHWIGANQEVLGFSSVQI